MGMFHKNVGYLKYGLVAVAIAVLPLWGCSSANFGGSSAFGGNRVAIADISDQGSFTAEGALAQARNHFRNNNYGYSAAFYKRAAELSPKNPQGYVGLGASYDRLGRFDLSDRVYASLHGITGDTAQYYNNVGYSYMLRGNLRAALTNFRKAAALEPDNMVITNNIQLLADAAASARV
jgi:Flp pilus assembly protein TadD